MDKLQKRLAEIKAAIDAFKAKDVKDLTAEEITQIDALSDEHEELTKKMAVQAKLDKMSTELNASAGRKTQTDSPATPRVEVGVDHSKRFGGFGSGGAFLKAVKNASNGNIDKRFQNATAQEKIGEDGGFLVPDEMAEGITQKLAGDSLSLLASTTQINVTGNSLTLNVDENQPWNGGVQAYWVGEGQPITDSKPSFKQPAWKLHKLAALVKATDELLDDAAALESYINAAAPNAIVYAVNKSLLSGNGVAKPQGIINSPFTVTISKESGQSADTILAENIVKMYNRLFPESRARAAWYINPQCEDQLRLLKDANGNYMYISPGGLGANIAASPFATLLGRPVIPLMGGIPALGDPGDIIFADMSYMYSIGKVNGIKAASSIHLYFDRDTTAFRFTLRLDARCPFQSPVTTEFGSYNMSAFAQIESR